MAVLSIIFLFATGAGCWLLFAPRRRFSWIVNLEDTPLLDASTVLKPPVELEIIANVPRIMYVDDSTSVVMRLVAHWKPHSLEYEQRDVIANINFMAAGFTVDPPDRSQTTTFRKPTDAAKQQSHLESIRWSIAPSRAGNHQITVIVNWENEQGGVYRVGIKQFNVKVVHILGLSSRAFRLLVAISGAITIVLLLAQVLVSS